MLQEEVWAEGVEKIIERDFFPDLQKLRNKKDWLEAVASGAPGLALASEEYCGFTYRECVLMFTSKLSFPSNSAQGTRRRSERHSCASRCGAIAVCAHENVAF